MPEEDSGSAAAPAPGGGVVLHPLVLVPGLTCSELEVRLTDAYRPTLPHCGAMKGKGWFGLWANTSDLPAHHYVPCFMEQMSLVYDPAAGDYRNLPGVETRVRNFGSSRGFQRNPEHTCGSYKLWPGRSSSSTIHIVNPEHTDCSPALVHAGTGASRSSGRSWRGSGTATATPSSGRPTTSATPRRCRASRPRSSPATSSS